MDIDHNDETMKPQHWDLFETVPAGMRAKVDSLEALFSYTLGKAAHIIYMSLGWGCEKCLEIPSTEKLKVRSFQHCPKRSPQFQYIIDGGTGILTFDAGIPQ